MSSSLENATSPFLRAHKDNPVQWRTWGPEVLIEAAAQDKPILLSLGYVGCHWCEVQNRESFSDPAIAALINENFIPVLSDREERPDLDMLYQGAAGAMGHEGGWPLNVFLHPDGVPFWVAGRQPAEDEGDVPSMRRVLTETAQLYRIDRPKADKTAANVRAAMANLYNRNTTSAQPNTNLDLAAMRIAQHYDIFFGGLLGSSQKFLNPLKLELMWRAFLRTGAQQFSQMIFTTLDGILFGGVYDHVGGGFFRHSQDERWLEPSFEKTLHDNAAMIELCTQVWQFNRNELCRQRVAETVEWLLRDMKVGGAFAGLIADGENGAYYLWSEAEIDAALVGTFSARFKQVYGISRDGNLNGRNLPRRLGNPTPANEADEALLLRQREMLLTSRLKRTLPWRDERLLADWNGLAIAALARAGMAFDKPEWIEAAVAAYDEVTAKLGDGGGRLFHIEGVKGFADDYANMARAALQLWEVTGEERFLSDAKAWTRTMDEHFWSTALGGYFYYADDAEPLVLRPRMLFDNPAPAANGTMLTVLTRLALLTGDPDYMSRGSTQAATFGDEANRVLNGSATYFIGFEYLVNSLTILVVGHKNNAQTKELIRAIWSKPVPNGLVVQMEPGDPLPPGHPATGRGMQGGLPTAYICQAGSCSDGFTTAAALADALTLPPQMRQQQSA